jgi:hypothetical protein
LALHLGHWRRRRSDGSMLIRDYSAAAGVTPNVQAQGSSLHSHQSRLAECSFAVSCGILILSWCNQEVHRLECRLPHFLKGLWLQGSPSLEMSTWGSLEVCSNTLQCPVDNNRSSTLQTTIQKGITLCASSISESLYPGLHISISRFIVLSDTSARPLSPFAAVGYQVLFCYRRYRPFSDSALISPVAQPSDNYTKWGPH